MGYTIEVYRRRQEPERHFGIYALYVMFYPQLVAGPIERPQNLLHQFHEKHYFDSSQFTDGIRLMLWGAVKKTVMADRLAIYVNAVYNHSSDYHYGNLIIATFFFAIQIYCDFSGYSDIAIGSARTMGFNLMTNFNRPYFSRNIQEFWKRWHISLSSWFRDYVYIPLGGNRIGIKRMYLNVAVVFLISGFWHRANWTFIIWGALHALYTMVYMLKNDFLRVKLQPNLLSSLTGWTITFVLVCIAWIFFRAGSLSEAYNIFISIVFFDASVPFAQIVTDFDSRNEFGFSSVLLSLFMIMFMFAFEALTPPDLVNLQKKTQADVVFMTLALVAIICLGVFNNTSFIYFQF
jgi:D-alanyl-lipoteichoic acid acyltransferase DltB (MBOAT superfamily)